MGGGWGDKGRAARKPYAAWGQGPCSTARDTYNNIFELCYRTKVLAAQLCLILCDPMDYPMRLLCPWNSPGKNTGVISHFLLQGSSGPRDQNPDLLHWVKFYTVWATRELRHPQQMEYISIFHYGKSESVCRSVVSNSWRPMACNPPGSSVHVILQARILEWVAIPFCRGFSQPRDGTRFPALQADSLPSESSGKPLHSKEGHSMITRKSSSGDYLRPD